MENLSCPFLILEFLKPDMNCCFVRALTKRKAQLERLEEQLTKLEVQATDKVNQIHSKISGSHLPQTKVWTLLSNV
jgi:hypothetical protein